MKKVFTLQHTAFAALTLVCASVSAQSSVELYGIIDATVMVGKGSVSNTTKLGNSGLSTSRLGFRGTEDLGGGLKAGFVLEAGFNNESGTGAATNPNNQGTYNPATRRFKANSAGGDGLTFGRRSMLTLASSAGELRLGRDYTPQFWQYSFFDPFTMNGVGASQIAAGNLGVPTWVRASNSVGYLLPKNLGGFYGQVQYYMGGNASTVVAPIGKNDGNGLAARLGYASGPWNMAVAVGRTDIAATGNNTTANAGLSYDFKVLKLSAMYNSDKLGNTAKSVGYLVGASMPVAAGHVRASYSHTKITTNGTTPQAGKFSLGYVHTMSKRTSLYANAAYVSNKDGANYALNGAKTAANASSKGIDFGIRHTF